MPCSVEISVASVKTVYPASRNRVDTMIRRWKVTMRQGGDGTPTEKRRQTCRLCTSPWAVRRPSWPAPISARASVINFGFGKS